MHIWALFVNMRFSGKTEEWPLTLEVGLSISTCWPGSQSQAVVVFVSDVTKHHYQTKWIQDQK
jgi:hypothetical protein